MIYLSSTTDIDEKYKWNEFGIMISANKSIGGWKNAMSSNVKWMMDNNAFSQSFSMKNWINGLIKYSPYIENCLGIPIPDSVGNSLETIRLFSKYYSIVHELGFMVAFVSQDGITPEITPWDSFDTLFIGGTDDHKLSDEAIVMIAEGKLRNKHVHVGRVNSQSRIKQFWMADSVDGTQLTIGGTSTSKQHEFADAVTWCRNRKNSMNANGQFKMQI